MSTADAELKAVVALGTRLCPWLREPLARLESARAMGRLGHAWLLNGPAGIGKINLALVFAHRLLAETDTEEVPPVLDAATAAAAMQQRHVPADHHPDLHWVFPEEDKRTIGIEQIRDAAQVLALKGFRGHGKVVVVEPAEAMTPAAANALLKTLEEPAEQTYLLLISHQPDRLLPTIRSRCQTLVVAPPTEDAVVDWLGVADDAARAALLLVAGRSPLRALRWLDQGRVKFISGLENSLNLVSSLKRDPRTVAEEWIKGDPAIALEWLARRLQQGIRERLAPADSKAVTHRPSDPMHNAWLALPVEVLFERLRAAEKLLDQLGSGINVELALHVLLMGFQPNRGRT